MPASILLNAAIAPGVPRWRNEWRPVGREEAREGDCAVRLVQGAKYRAKPGLVLVRQIQQFASATPMTIVIVDDSTSMREMLRVTFEDRGFHVFVAANAGECLGIADQNAVDAVLTDFDMPGESGLDLCRAVRMRSAMTGRDVRVWIMSGCPTLAADDVARVGAERLFRKPFRPADVCGNIQARLTSQASPENT